MPPSVPAPSHGSTSAGTFAWTPPLPPGGETGTTTWGGTMAGVPPVEDGGLFPSGGSTPVRPRSGTAGSGPTVSGGAGSGELLMEIVIVKPDLGDQPETWMM